jgi:LmbE family N-acetylglucosaminyl deacetylase
MQFKQDNSAIFVPDRQPADQAIRRTTHLAIAAHQDDLEIMSYQGILHCYGYDDRWYTGVVVTDGSGSPRSGLYAAYTDQAMQEVRRLEQDKAAAIGEYSAMVHLAYPSGDMKDPANINVISDLVDLLAEARPEIVYTHNLADKHETHIAVALRVIAAIRQLPLKDRPARLYGCEVWRDLDWLGDDEKVRFDVSGHPNLAAALLGVFDSQIAGGKRYDLAAVGRRLANATFSQSHGIDESPAVSYAMDLTPLIQDDTLDISDFINDHIRRFQDQVNSAIKRYL